MTLYERYKRLNIDFAQLCLEPGTLHSDYFCTPKGTKVIGWEGADGIHYGFIKGFGEMVFAINPSSLPGDHVHPLSRSFADFLRLLLSCGSTAAMEQAHMWNRREFDAFVESYPPDPEQRAALDLLRDELALTPMDDPYGYIRAVQASFDYGQIPFRKGYCDHVPEEPKPPERPEWKVYFGSGFGEHHTGHDKPGKEILVNTRFTWGGHVWYIPAVYACGQGLVADLCMEVEPSGLRAFLEKWQPWTHGDREFTPEEHDRFMAEHPQDFSFNLKTEVNGRELHRRGGSGFGWAPASCRPEHAHEEPCRQDWEALWLMEHYHLDPERAWTFERRSFSWATKAKPALRTLKLYLSQCPQPVSGPRFTVHGPGDAVPFTCPVTGEAHTLHVAEYEAHEMDPSHLSEGWEYPTHYTAMSYVVEPELPRQALTVRDCAQGDHPRMKQSPFSADQACSVGIIGSAAGPAAILLANGKSGHPRAACSSLRFQPPEQIEWRIVFYQNTAEDMEIELPLPPA